MKGKVFFESVDRELLHRFSPSLSSSPACLFTLYGIITLLASRTKITSSPFLWLQSFHGEKRERRASKSSLVSFHILYWFSFIFSLVHFNQCNGNSAPTWEGRKDPGVIKGMERERERTRRRKKDFSRVVRPDHQHPSFPFPSFDQNFFPSCLSIALLLHLSPFFSLLSGAKTLPLQFSYFWYISSPVFRWPSISPPVGFHGLQTCCPRFLSPDLDPPFFLWWLSPLWSTFISAPLFHSHQQRSYSIVLSLSNTVGDSTTIRSWFTPFYFFSLLFYQPEIFQSWKRGKKDKRRGKWTEES